MSALPPTSLSSSCCWVRPSCWSCSSSSAVTTAPSRTMTSPCCRVTITGCTASRACCCASWVSAAEISRVGTTRLAARSPASWRSASASSEVMLAWRSVLIVASSSARTCEEYVSTSAVRPASRIRSHSRAGMGARGLHLQRRQLRDEPLQLGGDVRLGQGPDVPTGEDRRDRARDRVVLGELLVADVSQWRHRLVDGLDGARRFLAFRRGLELGLEGDRARGTNVPRCHVTHLEAALAGHDAHGQDREQRDRQDRTHHAGRGPASSPVARLGLGQCPGDEHRSAAEP